MKRLRQEDTAELANKSEKCAAGNGDQVIGRATTMRGHGHLDALRGVLGVILGVIGLLVGLPMLLIWNIVPWGWYITVGSGTLVGLSFLYCWGWEWEHLPLQRS